MTTYNIKTKLAILASVATLALYSTAAMAATQNVTANIAFENAITLTKNADINFGVVTAGQANTYKIDIAAAVTVTGGAGSGVSLGGTKAAGDILIQGSATQTISIQANNFVANAGVTASLVTCGYNGGAETACTASAITGQAAPTGAGKTLLLGASATADGTQAAGSTAAPTFDVVVNYG